MRKTIVTLGLGLLLASPAFAAKSTHRTGGTASSTKSVKGQVAQPAGETKPADTKPAEAKPGKKHGGKKGGKKSEAAPAEAAPAK